MTTIQSSYDAALLADAVYLDFEDVTPGIPLTGEDLLAALQPNDPPEPNRLTQRQATYISNNYDLIAFQSDPLSGFQGAVFQHHSTGEYVLSLRGSEEVADYFADVDFHLKLNRDLHPTLTRLGEPEYGSGGFGFLRSSFPPRLD